MSRGHRLRRPRAIFSAKKLSLKSQPKVTPTCPKKGDGFANPLAPMSLHPSCKARLRPAGYGTGYAALRLQAFFQCWLAASRGRCARSFTSAGFASPFFAASLAIPPEVCHCPAEPARRIHKRGALRVFLPSYKASAFMPVLPLAAVFRARNSEKNGDAEKLDPAEKKQNLEGPKS